MIKHKILLLVIFTIAAVLLMGCTQLPTTNKPSSTPSATNAHYTTQNNEQYKSAKIDGSSSNCQEILNMYSSLKSKYNNLMYEYNNTKSKYQELLSEYNSLESKYSTLKSEYNNLKYEYNNTEFNYQKLLRIVNLEESENLVSSKTINQPAGESTEFTFSLSYPGYIVVNVGSSTTTKTYVSCSYNSYDVNFDKTEDVGSSGIASFPVLPGTITIAVGNNNIVNGATETVSITYYY